MYKKKAIADLKENNIKWHYETTKKKKIWKSCRNITDRKMWFVKTKILIFEKIIF